MAGAVGGVAGASHWGLAVITGVATESALINLAIGRAVEGQPHVFQVDYCIHRLFRQNLSGVLVNQVVTTLDCVESVPLPAVLFDVGQRSRHPTLRRTGVRASRE